MTQEALLAKATIYKDRTNTEHPDLDDYRLTLQDAFGVKDLNDSRAQVFDRSRRLTYRELQRTMDSLMPDASSQPSSSGKLCSKRRLGSIFSSDRMDTVATVTDSHLLYHTRCRISSKSVHGLHKKYIHYLRAEGLYLPCGHWSICGEGTKSIFSAPTVTLKVFLEQVRAFGDFEVLSDDRADLETPAAQHACRKCRTDMASRFYTREGGRTYVMELHVWHDLGSFRSPQESEWIRMATRLQAFLTTPRPNLRIGAVREAFEGREITDMWSELQESETNAGRASTAGHSVEDLTDRHEV